MQVATKELLVKKFDLQPHPEGGYFKETYRSGDVISRSGLPDRFPGARTASTGIYFLLEQGNFSAFHRIKSDEMWHFYEGDMIEIFTIKPNGVLEKIKLGRNIENGEVFQAVIPAECWFASRVNKHGEYGLVGCTVAPGFDFMDFELADRKELIEQFPQHEEIITTLTRIFP